MGSNRFKVCDVQGCKSKDMLKPLEALSKAGIIIPVPHTDGNGLPLGSEEDTDCRKNILIDTGLLLRIEDGTMNDLRQNASFILTSTASALANKDPLAEMVAGLEMSRYPVSGLRHVLHYWLRPAKNATAGVDYLASQDQSALPIEVKTDTQGGMKGLSLPGKLRQDQL